MSSALLSNLPRFDRDDQTHPAEQLKRMLGQMQTAASRPAAVQPQPEEITATDQPTQEDLGPAFAEVEVLISQLSATLTRIENESHDQSMQAIQALAARLFPELSRQFLAEEIARHLPKLVPASVPSLDIRAKQDMLDKLEPIIAREPSLSGRCKLTLATPADDLHVLVSWKTGGVTFDFEGLLAACLAHLDPSHTMIEE